MRGERVRLREVAARVHSLAIHLLRRVRRADPVMGLTPARASALSVVVFGGPVTLGELAAAEQVSAPTMTRIVAGLQVGGLVVRSRDRRDRRVVRVRATVKGRRVLERGRQRRVEQMVALLEGLRREELGVVEEAVGLLEGVVSGPVGPGHGRSEGRRALGRGGGGSGA
ncbi:MAG: MarR family transcriptional regulator [Gemmatimonadetes bacterium]|nr:MarR family transcriptional regulator [Gemmatimonadota bacterium]